MCNEPTFVAVPMGLVVFGWWFWSHMVVAMFGMSFEMVSTSWGRWVGGRGQVVGRRVVRSSYWSCS